MPPLKHIVCLANSEKLRERCIAGIDLNTGKWVRPVCDELYPQDGRVPKSIRLVEGREPEVLDILQIPLSDTGNDFGFECENLSVVAGEWKYIGRVEPTDLFRYCGNFVQILHNSRKYVNPSYLQTLPFHQRRTLQLVRSVNFYVEKKTSFKGNTEWRGSLQTANGQQLRDAKITDPVFVEKLNTQYQPKSNCLVTVSLSMPYRPHPEWEGEDPCWKLISAVIEL